MAKERKETAIMKRSKCCGEGENAGTVGCEDRRRKKDDMRIERASFDQGQEERWEKSGTMSNIALRCFSKRGRHFPQDNTRKKNHYHIDKFQSAGVRRRREEREEGREREGGGGQC
ncbi:hypothetical protein HPP92_000734 [Vanilla planifolia]|uniref:Uncharacterized protein n=1 Tax=Vanilla planifolia TaxID=51239 RepID=A0A835VG92_VANPL|nr:hypothetical protein HPP92_000734 [Vanilla planifolia]